ncbi:MAG: hypothetical protein Q9165_008062 [Trypethelium subeluteriae]
MYFVLLLFFSLTANSALLPRLPAGCEGDFEDIEMVELNDGPTTAGDAGIGAEFETPLFNFQNKDCSLDDTFAAKRKTVQGRTGTNFVLSVDTGSTELGKGKLNPEYVLDGKNIKVGDGSATAAGKAATGDLMGWTPWTDNPPNQITIQDFPQCNPWMVTGLDQNTDKGGIFWVPQVTAPMPLEALYSLMQENLRGTLNGRNILNGQTSFTTGQNLQLVTKEYFQSASLKMDPNKITDDVLGFCTLVLSYAKAADKDQPADTSPKHWLTFMPRTEFNTIYSSVKSKFSGPLFDVFNTLACYKTDQGERVTLDTDYCTGTAAKPVTGNKFAGLQYKYTGESNAAGTNPLTVNIKDWIQNIGIGYPSPDSLSAFDQHYDGSIGGLNKAVEKLYRSQRTVPLFEFRDLDPLTTMDFESFMDSVDSAIQTLHQRFATPPARKMKIRRRGDALNCTLPSNGTGILPPNSTGVSPSNGTGNLPSNGTGSLPSNGTGNLPSNGTSPPHPSDPAVKCIYQDATPENPAECTCSSNGKTTVVAPRTLPSVSVMTESCRYTTWPDGAPTVTQPPQTVTTNFAGCQRCTVVGPNEDDCEPLPSSLGCTPQSKSTVLSADTSGVTAGTLTGSALFSAITSGIDGLCQVPPNTGGGTGSFTCSESAVATIASDVHYVSDEAGEKSWDFKGELEMQITEGSYDSLVWYEGAKAVIAALAQNSTQGNCQNMTADTVNTHNYPNTMGPATFTICNVGSHFQIVEFDPTNKGPAREISFDLKFQRDSSEDFICQFLENVVEFIEVAVNVETDTETAIPEEIKIDEKLLDACKGAAGG